VLADNQLVMPEAFERYLFDMNGEWPDTGLFGEIWFPQSIAHREWEDKPFEERVQRYRNLLSQALSRLERGGEIVAVGDLPPLETIAAALGSIQICIDYKDANFIQIRRA
jgi:hypothetical protein